MATQQYTGVGAYRCPDCDGEIAFEHQAWECEDCGYAPRHGAD
ncbi:hypothetical protein [Halosimplex salinum]|nr:hypothetical protein [Halosimplex salinum]